MTGARGEVANGEHRVRAGALDLNVRVEGPPGAEWVTLSHSLATELAAWDAIASRLADRFRVLRYDMRGHGRSAVPDAGSIDGTTMDALAFDAVHLLDHFGIARTDFIGVSIGGMTALGLGILAPERVRSLTVIAARPDMPQAMQSVWDERTATVRAGGMETQVESTLARWFTPAFRAARPDRVAPVAAMIRATSVNGYLAAGAALRQLDYRSRLGAIAAPSLVMCGTEDEAMFAPSQAMAAVIPGARFVAIADAAHQVPVERPEALLAAIEGFLSERTTARP